MAKKKKAKKKTKIDRLYAEEFVDRCREIDLRGDYLTIDFRDGSYARFDITDNRY